MSKEIQLSASEEAALLALAAKGALRGDKRTDAVAGTIHAPTAKRLCEKGLVGLRTAGYALTDAGKARLPGAAALQPTEPRDCKKYLGRTLKGQQVILCDKPEKHEGNCDNALLKPMDDEHGVVLEAAKALGVIEFVHVGDKLPKPPNGATPLGQKRVKAKVESRASIEAKAAESKNQQFIGSLPESTRAWAQERADAAIGRKPKASEADAAPAIVADALANGATPTAPALLAEALDPPGGQTT